MAARRIHVPATLTGEGIERLHAEVRAALQSADDRVIVLHGDGQTFCLGAELTELLNAGDVGSQARAFAALLTELVSSPKPIVAEVRGQAAAGGVGLVAAADLVVASEQATFSLSEALFGVVPAIIAPMLLRRMTAARVTLWSIASETLTASDAHAVGLVDVCVPAQVLEETTQAWSRRLTRAVPDAVASMKRHVNRAALLRPDDGVEMTAERFKDPEVLHRVKAFVEHGTAPWLKAE